LGGILIQSQPRQDLEDLDPDAAVVHQILGDTTGSVRKGMLSDMLQAAHDHLKRNRDLRKTIDLEDVQLVHEIEDIVNELWPGLELRFGAISA
jgi:hypothetical protein